MSHLESKGKEGGPDEEDNLKSLPAPSLFFFFFLRVASATRAAGQIGLPRERPLTVSVSALCGRCAGPDRVTGPLIHTDLGQPPNEGRFCTLLWTPECYDGPDIYLSVRF